MNIYIDIETIPAGDKLTDMPPSGNIKKQNHEKREYV